ncbi:MAG: hypothetical protein F6K19_21620 [Cyanothece sp. SIO1E1]|nr:hypothetical protein [Cyanothece sp. SIO1E1]
MKTKTILRASQLIFTALLTLVYCSLSAQVLPDFGANLKKGELYYLDYEVSRLFGLRSPSSDLDPHKLDTHSVVQRTIRIEIVEELPNQEYILTLSSERVVSQYKHGLKWSVHDDAYPTSSLSKNRKKKPYDFSFGSYIAPPYHRDQGPIQKAQFSHLKVDANLTVLKVYQNEQDAKLDGGRAPHQPLHLWLDFDLIGIWLQKDQMISSPYLAPIWKREAPSFVRSDGRLKHYTANYIDALAIDKESGWLHYAQMIDKKEASPSMTLLKTIKGWKGQARKRTIVHGYARTTKGIIRKENLTERVPFYFDKGREDITIDTNGYFRWVAYIDQPTYFSLRDLKGSDPKKIYGYIQPGDKLYLEVNFDRLETLVFQGKNKFANEFLNKNDGLPLPGLTEWFGQITTPISAWAQKDVNELVKNARKKCLARLKAKKGILDPRFYQDEYWRLTYSITQFIKSRPGDKWTIPKDKFLPIINMQAEHLPAFWANIEDFTKQKVRQHHSNIISRSYLSFRERYTGSKLFLSGFAQHMVMYHALREALYIKKLSQEEVAFMASEFLNLCQDKELTDNIRLLLRQVNQTRPGNYFLNLQLFDSNGKKLEMKDFMGKKVVLEPAFNALAGLSPRNYQQVQEKYPNIHFVCLELSGYPEFFQSLEDIGALNSTSDNSVYYLSDPQELKRAYQFLALDPLHPYSNYPRFFFLDEKGKIIEQPYASLADNLKEFAAQPSVIVPLWKNPAWQAAIALSLLFGLLTWLSLRIMGRIRERNLERQRQMVEMELNSIRSQLNPHFVYNTMSSIQNLILSDRSQQASQYLAELAGLMRAVLNQTKKGIISLEEELSTIRQYCKLEALRKSFAWNIKVDKSVDLHNTDIPALLLQPYVENAIIHGLRGNEVDGKIDLTISQKNGSLDIVIQDNGVGIAENLHRSMGGNQLGLHLNRKRLELLYGKLAKVIIQDLNQLKKGKKGTQVSINIPM